jgi:hypothetical protein
MAMTWVRLACLIPLLAAAVSGPTSPAADAPPPFAQECTIGVAAGHATVDGRPLLWKVRDQPAAPNNEVYFNGSLAHRFVAVVDANGHDASSAWLGVNEHGFAVLNANVEDLANAKAARANGGFMRDALGGCRSAAEFVALLDSTNGGRDTHGNFGVIDSTGAAVMFEVSPDTFWSYDAEAVPLGFIVRTNFACHDTAGTGIDGLPGDERFVRAQNYISDLATGDTLSCANLLGRLARDFSDWASRPIEVPCHACGEPDSLYGYIDTFFSICSSNTVCGGVIQGVAPPPAGTEPAWLSTLWVQLGQPACTLASPYWPLGATPVAADGDTTAPLCDLAATIRGVVFPSSTYGRLVDSFSLRDDAGGGLWAHLLPAEAAILEATEERLDYWRQAPPTWQTVLAFEDSLAIAAFDVLHTAWLTAAPADPAADTAPPAASLAAIGPNPFNPRTTLEVTLAREGRARLEILDLRGRRVDGLVDGHLAAGTHRFIWQPAGEASGVYVARLTAGGGVVARCLMLLR